MGRVTQGGHQAVNHQPGAPREQDLQHVPCSSDKASVEVVPHHPAPVLQMLLLLVPEGHLTLMRGD